MTGLEFTTYVKAKLNRLDTSSYEDVRNEEIYFFAREALKALTLKFDNYAYSSVTAPDTLKNYLASVTRISPELAVVGNEFTLPRILKLKDVSTYVVIGAEEGWRPTRSITNNVSSTVQDNEFLKSFPDTPAYRLVDNNIKFEGDGFNCTKIKYEYLEYPAEFTDVSTIEYPFNSELENETVTQILENLESRRLQSQTVISKS